MFTNNKLFVACLLVAGVFLFKVNTVTLENGFWFSLSLFSDQRFVYVLLSSSYCIQDLTTVCIFLFWLWKLSINYIVKIWYCSHLCQFASVQSHNSKIRPINSVKILFCSKSVVLVTNEFN